jgi:hypothetical protein
MADNNNGSSGNQKPSLSWSQPAAPQASTTKPLSSSPAKNNSHTAGAQAALASQANSNMGTYVGIFVVGLIVGAALGWGITLSSRGGNASVTASSTDMTSSSTSGTSANTGNATAGTASTDLGSTMAAGANNITVASPQQAGFAVAVSKIMVKQPTWLVVYENNNGTPGNAIGAGLFFADSTSGTIELLRATLPGQSYLVGQSLDDGDKIFSLATDKPVRDEKGNPLFTEFTAK